MRKIEINYSEMDIEKVFQKLISRWDALTEFYHKEVNNEPNITSNRLDYLDIAHIARFIVEQKISGQTDNFEPFFEIVEELLIHGDQYVHELIVIGLFEGIQNVGSSEIDYYRSFDKWLKPKSLNAWRELIDFWEKDDWKKTTESEKILKKNKK